MRASAPRSPFDGMSNFVGGSSVTCGNGTVELDDQGAGRVGKTTKQPFSRIVDRAKQFAHEVEIDGRTYRLRP